MRIYRIKINSSVIVINLAVLLVSLATLFIGWVTENQALLETLLTPSQLLIVTTVQSALTMLLRSTNLQGKKPIEILPKEEATVDRPE